MPCRLFNDRLHLSKLSDDYLEAHEQYTASHFRISVQAKVCYFVFPHFMYRPMGRGIGWTDVEMAHLASGWVYASEDAIAGVDQTATRFRETMFEKYKSFAPKGCSRKSYGGRSPKSVRAKFNEVATDIQKFREALRCIRAANPTGVTEHEVISMSIAKHLGKRSGMSYEVRSYLHSEWKNNLAYEVLRLHPKLSDERSASGRTVTPVQQIDVQSSVDAVVSTSASTSASNTTPREQC